MAKTTDPAESLRIAVNETSGTATTISPKENGWSGYLLQQKTHFEAKTLPELHEQMTVHILANRTAVPVKSKETKRKSKPFKYDKK